MHLACGTVRANQKGLPVPLLPKNVRLERHEFKVAQFDDLTCATCRDKKPVLTLSNFHDPTDIGQVKRHTAGSYRQNVNAPKSLADYQENMKGVDLLEQMIGYYMLQHRSKKWWRRIFYYLLMAISYNGYVLARESNPKEVLEQYPNYQDYSEDLALELIGDTVRNWLTAIDIAAKMSTAHPNQTATAKTRLKN